MREINTYDDNRNWPRWIIHSQFRLHRNYSIQRGWLTKREYKRGSTNIYTFNSSGSGDFDKVGNLKKVVYTHKSDDPDSMAYSYDVHSRLTQFKHNGSVLRDYEYDANGNRRDAGNEIFAYANNNNQLTAFDNGSIAISFTFDAAGRVKKIGSTDLKYDLFNKMTEHGSGNKYTYDAANQRLRKTENGDSTYYFTNGLEVLAEYDENDNLQAEHIYGLGRMLAKFAPGAGHTFFYTDHLGSTRLVGGSSETSDDMRRDYYPYGEELTAAGNDDTPYTFVGKELDSATGLHYFGARYYDARIGRWYVPDALAEKYPAWSPYNYSFDNPINYIDFDGRDGFYFGLSGFGGVSLLPVRSSSSSGFLGGFGVQGLASVTVAVNLSPFEVKAFFTRGGGIGLNQKPIGAGAGVIGSIGLFRGTFSDLPGQGFAISGLLGQGKAVGFNLILPENADLTELVPKGTTFDVGAGIGTSALIGIVPTKTTEIVTGTKSIRLNPISGQAPADRSSVSVSADDLRKYFEIADFLGDGPNLGRREQALIRSQVRQEELAEKHRRESQK